MPDLPVPSFPSKTTEILAALESLLNSRLGNAVLILVWPLLVAGLGFPTGIAEQALSYYLGRDLSAPVEGEAKMECPPCPAAPASVAVPETK